MKDLRPQPCYGALCAVGICTPPHPTKGGFVKMHWEKRLTRNLKCLAYKEEFVMGRENKSLNHVKRYTGRFKVSGGDFMQEIHLTLCEKTGLWTWCFVILCLKTGRVGEDFVVSDHCSVPTYWGWHFLNRVEQTLTFCWPFFPTSISPQDVSPHTHNALTELWNRKCFSRFHFVFLSFSGGL